MSRPEPKFKKDSFVKFIINEYHKGPRESGPRRVLEVEWNFTAQVWQYICQNAQGEKYPWVVPEPQLKEVPIVDA